MNYTLEIETITPEKKLFNYVSEGFPLLGWRKTKRTEDFVHFLPVPTRIAKSRLKYAIEKYKGKKIMVELTPHLKCSTHTRYEPSCRHCQSLWVDRKLMVKDGVPYVKYQGKEAEVTLAHKRSSYGPVGWRFRTPDELEVWSEYRERMLENKREE